MSSFDNSKFLEEFRPQQIQLFKTLDLFRSKGIPVEDAFYNRVKTAHDKIIAGEEYTACFDTAGLHYTLSRRSWYNPYADGYYTIINENCNGWDQRVGVHNVCSATGYRMFRLDGVFYLVYVNRDNEINKVESDNWIKTEIGIDASSPPAVASATEAPAAGGAGNAAPSTLSGGDPVT